MADIIESVTGISKPVVETTCRILESLMLGGTTQIGGMLEDTIKQWRMKNLVRIVHKTDNLLGEEGLGTYSETIQKGFLLPFLKQAADIENESLQEMWAHLLASAAQDPALQHPGYIKILSELSPLDAQLLKHLHDVGAGMQHTFSIQKEASRLQIRKTNINRSCSNLIRLGLCQDGSTAPYPKARPGVLPQVICLSVYGNEFLSACTD